MVYEIKRSHCICLNLQAPDQKSNSKAPVFRCLPIGGPDSQKVPYCRAQLIGCLWVKIKALKRTLEFQQYSLRVWGAACPLKKENFVPKRQRSKKRRIHRLKLLLLSDFWRKFSQVVALFHLIVAIFYVNK